MVYAQIKDGVVKNIIVVDEGTDLSVFSAGYDYFKRVDNIQNQPGVGYLYDSQNDSYTDYRD